MPNVLAQWRKTSRGVDSSPPIPFRVNKQLRRKTSPGKRHYNKRAPQPDITMSTLVALVDMIEKPEGLHNNNIKLFSISIPQLRSLQELALESTNFDYSSAKYRATAIILDIANYRLFRPVRSVVPAEKPKHFMKTKFFNKAEIKKFGGGVNSETLISYFMSVLPYK